MTEIQDLGYTATNAVGRTWTIYVCPICGELPEHLGEGRQGCGRHIGTTYFRGAGVTRSSDRGNDFVPVLVRPVTTATNGDLQP